MIQVIHITDFDGLKDLVFEQERNTNTGRFRSSYFYRGMADAAYTLTTSLYRNCGEKQQVLEAPLLENFIKYGSIEDPSIAESIWKAMIVGQHHGLPTRLLDWTHSTIAALHFANSGLSFEQLDKSDCAVWRIDARELKQLLPKRYFEALEAKKTFVFSVDTLKGVTDSISEYDQDMAGNALVLLEPPSIDQRIVNQYSFFTVIPSKMANLESFLDAHTNKTVKYVIDRKLRWDLRDILDQLNMNERMIYPGMDGIAKWLARHYYVKR